MNWKIIVAAVILILFLSGCTEPVPGPKPVADDSGATAEGVSELVHGNNQFALELYKEFQGTEQGKNIFFSPWSMSFALGMTFEGAKGQTAEEMQSVLHLPADDTARRFSFAKVYNLINSGDKPYKLSTANALWAQKDYAFLQDYFETVEKYYVGKVTNLDFKADTENSRKTINTWVEQQTNNKIKDLIPPGVLDPLTRLVLTNAIYFKGTWVTQFNPAYTKPEDFKVSPSKTVKADMMRIVGSDTRFNYAETEELQALELPYKGDDLSMLILLPKEDSPDSLEASLTAEKLQEIRDMLEERKIPIFIPKFTFETKYMMVPALESMGIHAAFVPNSGNDPNAADLSGMDGTKNLYISSIIHQAFVQVDEEGTEAAAATAVVVGATSAGPMNEFRADHPFIFIIQERSTGSILFLGRVTDPTA